LRPLRTAAFAFGSRAGLCLLAVLALQTASHSPPIVVLSLAEIAETVVKFSVRLIGWLGVLACLAACGERAAPTTRPAAPSAAAAVAPSGPASAATELGSPPAPAPAAIVAKPTFPGESLSVAAGLIDLLANY